LSLVNFFRYEESWYRKEEKAAMQRHDKFFIIIIIGVVLLIVVALVIMFTSDAAEYVDDSSPEGVAQNFLLALQKEDYSRAYSYLSKTIPDFPNTLSQFKTSIGEQEFTVERRKALVFSVESVELVGSTRAEVTFTEIRSSGSGLLSGDQSFGYFSITLLKENDQWKVKECSNYLFFSWKWRL
jgi:hypothetical protein